jgi:hypothetical protein
MEQWKQTYIREDYEVSNLGRVRRVKRGPANKRIFAEPYSYIKGKLCRNGYHRIKVGRKEYGAHRLVAIAFIPNTENKPDVNHIDGNKQNNSLSNLEWVTKKENMIHAKLNGLAANQYG